MIDGATYRLIVYRSSVLGAHQTKSVGRAIAKARESLTRAAQALTKQTFHCAHDAEVAAQAFQAQAEYQWFPQSPVRSRRDSNACPRVGVGLARMLPPRRSGPPQPPWGR